MWDYFVTSCHHLATNHLVLEPLALTARRQARSREHARLGMSPPTVCLSHGLCGISSSFGYRILKQWRLFMLQISRGSLYYLITHLRAASSPHVLCPANAHSGNSDGIQAFPDAFCYFVIPVLLRLLTNQGPLQCTQSVISIK